MFAVVQWGSSQFKVSEGDIINVDRLAKEDEISFDFDKVLLFVNEQDVRVGQPYLKDVTVSAKVIKDVSGVKTVAYKYWKRKSNALKIGHRQKFTEVNISKITAK